MTYEPTSDTRVILYPTVLAQFGQSAPSGVARINSIKTNKVVTNEILCYGDVKIVGTLDAAGVITDIGNPNEVIINDPAGALTGEAQLATSRGGTGLAGFTSGRFVTASSASALATTVVVPAGSVVGTTDAQALTNKTITDATNNVAANSLKTTGASVGVAAAAPPAVGNVLTATSATTATWQAPAAATGDVVGPGAATDNAICRFDGITGKLIQDSLVTIGDTGILHVDVIGELTASAGVTVDEILMRTDLLVAPAITLASIRPTTIAANVSVTIAPKGTGALLADIPDNAATGGNIRGSNAVDLQIVRSAATKVASGDNSVIAGGQSNLAAGANSVCCGGSTNTVSNDFGSIGGGTGNIVNGDYGTVCGGTGNTAGAYGVVGGGTTNVVGGAGQATIGGGQDNISSGQFSTVGGGDANTASGDSSCVAGGSNNTASGLNSTIPGGDSNTATASYTLAAGRNAHAINAGAFVFADSTAVSLSSSAVDQFLCRFASGYRLNGGTFALNDRELTYTTGSTSTVGAVTGDLYTIATASNTTIGARIMVIGGTSAGNSFSMEASATVKNVAGTVTVVGSYNAAGFASDAAINAATVAYVASGANLIVRVTGVGGQTIGWRGVLRLIAFAF